MDAQIKSCTKCGNPKPLSEFYSDSRRPDGLRASCKQCHRDHSKKHWAENRAEIYAVQVIWRKNNLTAIAARARAKYESDPSAAMARSAAWSLANPEKRRESVKRSWAKLPSDEKSRRLSSKYQKARERPSFRVRDNVSRGVRRCLVSGKGGQSISKLLGYSIDELRRHLERQFLRGMSWDNYGKWHIDHILPLASFKIESTDSGDFRRAWSLANLRPLWGKDNQLKGAEIHALL